MQLQSGKSMLLEAAVLIYKLKDDQLYSPWQVAASGYDRNQQRQDYDRIRLNLGEWSRYHNIRETFENRDEEGNRQGRFPAWFGRSWKEHLGYKDMKAAKSWIEKQADHTPKIIEIKTQVAEAESIQPVTPAKPILTLNRVITAAISIAAAVALFMALAPKPELSIEPGLITQATPEPEAITPEQLEVRQFSRSRMLARADKAPVRAQQFHHPTIMDLVWEMTLIDGPMLAQAAIMPNCVFLVSRTHKDMMPLHD